MSESVGAGVTVHVRQAVLCVGERQHRLVLAVSGGIDSMVLLDAAVAVLPKERLVVATLDHGTGAHGTSAVRLVRRRARALGIECVAGRASEVATSEAALREARWRFLRSVASRFDGVVCTAHTCDDQIETILMRVLRGAGARGLAGLYAESTIARPLLAFRRTDVERYAAERRLDWVEDPSNRSMRFLRNRVRHQLLPALRNSRPAIETELLAAARDAAQWRRDVQQTVSTT